MDDIRGRTEMSYTKFTKEALNNSLMYLKDIGSLLKEDYSKGYSKEKLTMKSGFTLMYAGIR